MKLTKTQRTIVLASVAGLATLEATVRTAKGQGFKNPWLNGLVAGVAVGCLVCQTSDTIDMFELLHELKKIK